MMAAMERTDPAPHDGAAPPSLLDALYARLADELRARWHPDLPVGRWLALSWELVRALRDTHGQGWAEIAEELNARGVRRDRGLPFSAAWLSRRVLSAVLWRVHERERAQTPDPGRGDAGAEPLWFPVGPLLGGPGHRRTREPGRAGKGGSAGR
jgi:hypothetical protein